MICSKKEMENKCRLDRSMLGVVFHRSFDNEVRRFSDTNFVHIFYLMFFIFYYCSCVIQIWKEDFF